MYGFLKILNLLDLTLPRPSPLRKQARGGRKLLLKSPSPVYGEGDLGGEVGTRQTSITICYLFQATLKAIIPMLESFIP
jgi:hypothetical protein